jgi:hypothetical protein
MTIEQVNQILARRPVSAQPSKAPAAVKQPDTKTLAARIAEARKAVGAVIAQAKRLGSTRIIKQVRSLSEQLVALDAELTRISMV